MTTSFEAPHPFRWNLARRDQLGSLLDGPVAPTYTGFLPDLLEATARVVGFSDDSDLVFVGRSLESMFDLLSGLVQGTSWEDRLQLLHFSARFVDLDAVPLDFPHAIRSLHVYLESMRLDPDALVARPRPVAFIDVVSSGSTLGNLMSLLRTWSQEQRGNWQMTARKIRIVGVTKRQKTSPNTWRWQQHAERTSILDIDTIKNVSIPQRLFTYLADEQAKVSESFPPWRWGDQNIAQPTRDERTLQALRLAVEFFDHGRRRETRQLFAARLAKQRAMRQRWLRSLVLDLKR